MLPYKVAHKERARKLRRNMTLAEKKIWSELLRKDGLEGYRFLRQKPLDNYIADFYCAELLLVIEIDGESHLAEGAIPPCPPFQKGGKGGFREQKS